jgi:hypothetical protein
MKYTYKVTENALGETNIIQIDENGVMASIPTDPANSDYQAYLLSLEPTNDKS